MMNLQKVKETVRITDTPKIAPQATANPRAGTSKRVPRKFGASPPGDKSPGYKGAT
jgi:hypothetical protein